MRYDDYANTENRTMHRNRKFTSIISCILGILFIAIGIIVVLTIKNSIVEAILFSFGTAGILLSIVLFTKNRKLK